MKLREILRTPPVDFTPTGSRVLDLALNVIDAIETATLLVLFVIFGKVPPR